MKEIEIRVPTVAFLISSCFAFFPIPCFAVSVYIVEGVLPDDVVFAIVSIVMGMASFALSALAIVTKPERLEWLGLAPSLGPILPAIAVVYGFFLLVT